MSSFLDLEWARVAALRAPRRLRSLAGDDADLLPVVKANAYGHGLLECAAPLVAAGAEWLGVTSVEEGERVRAVCPRALVMSGVWHGEAEALDESANRSNL